MRGTLALVAVAVTAMVALAFLIPLGLMIGEIARERALTDAERQATALVPALAITTEPAALERAMTTIPAGTEARLAVHLPGGGSLGRVRAGRRDVAAAAVQEKAVAVPVRGGHVLLRPSTLDRGRTAVIEVYVPNADLSRGVATSWIILSAVALSLVLISVVVADRLGSRVVRASRRLAEAATNLGAGDLSVRIHPEGPPELVAAANAFNTMANRVEGLVAAERETAADLSHRLRTPLTALKLGLGDASDQSKRAMERLEVEVDSIITASRRSDTAAAEPAPSCDAAEVLRERLAFWSALAEDQAREWQLIGADEVIRVALGPADLTTIVDTLLGNVFKHTPEGCAFAVTIQAGVTRAGILVADAGPGITEPATAVERGHSGAGSTGLGLDIAKRLAETSGGSLRIDRSSLGGAQVQVWLPIMPLEPSLGRHLVAD